jgi:hypothetical protein
LDFVLLYSGCQERIGTFTPSFSANSLASSYPHGSRIGRQHALDALGHHLGSVGDGDLPGVQRVANAHAAAVVDRNPTAPLAVLSSAFSSGQSATASLPSFMLRFRDKARPPSRSRDDRGRSRWGFDLSLLHQVVHGQPELRALAVAQPADARRQSLELDALARQVDPAARMRFSGNSSSTRSSVTECPKGSPESATQRNGPRPSQNSGRMYAGTNPGKS